MANTERTESRAYLAVLLGLVALFFLPALNNTFFFRDAFNLFFPYKAAEASYLRDFSVCLWNPWEVLGSSFVGALATGWFYPGNVFFMILPPEPAYRLFIFSHYLMAALFMWLWLREEGRSKSAAASAALAYTLSGYLLSQNGMPDMLASCAWLPTSLWLVSRFLKKGGFVYIALFGAALAMPFLAGRAEAVIINAAACLVLVMLSGNAGETALSRTKKAVWILAGGGIIALLISMVQFLPSLELGRLSLKGHGFSLSESTLWSFHPARFIEFFFSSPWGRFWPEADYRAANLTGWENHYPWALSHYMGLVMLLGAMVALFKASWKKSAALALLLLVVVAYSAGKYFPLYPALFKTVPLLHIFRYPEKYMVLAVALLCACGAYGIDTAAARLIQGISGKLEKPLVAAAVALPLVAVAVIALLSFQDPGMLSMRHLLFNIAHVAFVLAAIAGLAVFTSRFKSRSSVFGAGVLIVCALDIFLANHWIIPYAKPDIFHFEPRALNHIREHAQSSGKDFFDKDGRPLLGRFRVMREPGVPPDYALGMIEGEYAYEKFQRFERHTLAPNFNFVQNIEEITGYTAAMTRDYDRLMKDHLDVMTMRLFNVHYLVRPIYDTQEKSRLPEIVADPRGFGVYRIPGPFPRAYMVGESSRCEDPLARPETFLQNHDFKTAVVLKDRPGLPPKGKEEPLKMTSAKVVSYRPTEVVIQARAPVPCYLVLSDSFYPGWKAWSDGEEKRIYQANFLVRAIRLEAGEHKVVFKYRPSLYYIGRAVSLAALCLLAAVLAGTALRRVRKRPS